MSSCILNAPAEISDVTLDRNTVRFSCGLGGQSVSFTGTVSGNEIEFVWDLLTPEFDFPVTTLFGGTVPRRFTARRVPDVADTVTAAADRARKAADVTFDRLLNAPAEPHNWLMYSGTVLGERHSRLTQITPENVKNLEVAWIWQSASFPEGFQATPLVVDGILYTVEAPNNVFALDAASGRVLWSFRDPRNALTARVSGNTTNRGLAILGDQLFMGTLDAHLLAIDVYSGKLLWKVAVADEIRLHAGSLLRDHECSSRGEGQSDHRCRWWR